MTSGLKKPISREGNKALEIVRPLFETGQKVDFKETKKFLLSKFPPTVSSILHSKNVFRFRKMNNKTGLTIIFYQN